MDWFLYDNGLRHESVTSKSMDWFLYDRDLRHERVKERDPGTYLADEDTDAPLLHLSY